MKEIALYLYEDVADGSARDFVAKLESADADVIRLHINSYGGDLSDGMAIYSALKSHPARVIVEVDGMCASIASIIAMAGDEIEMSPGSRMMIHDALVPVNGDAASHRDAAARLDSISDQMAAIYCARTGDSVESCREKMRTETWFTPDEAVAAGYADRVGKAKARVAARLTAERVAALGYRHVPADMIVTAGTQETNMDPKLIELITKIAESAGTDPATVVERMTEMADKIGGMLRTELDTAPEPEEAPEAADAPEPEEDDSEAIVAAAEYRAAQNAVLAALVAKVDAITARLDAADGAAKDAARAAKAAADDAFIAGEIKSGVILEHERADALAILTSEGGRERYGRVYGGRQGTSKGAPIGVTQAGNEPARDRAAADDAQIMDSLSASERIAHGALVKSGRYTNKTAAERIVSARAKH